MTKNPQKILKGRYQVVPRTIILLLKDKKVLLQKAPETKKLFPGFYNGLGGHIERNEDILSAARREVLEESGLSCTNLKLYGSVLIDVNENQGILMFVFSGDDIKGELIASPEGSLHWIDVESLDTINVVEDVPELITRITQIGSSGKLFHGRYWYTQDGKRQTEFYEA